MLELNLLSPEDKENLRWEKVNLKIQGLIFAVLVMSFALVALATVGIQYLNIQKSVAEGELAVAKSHPATKEAMEMNRQLEEFTRQTQAFSRLDDGQLNWTILMEELSKLRGDGIKFESLTAQKLGDGQDKNGSVDNFRVELTGKAIARKNLLLLEDGLKHSKLCSDLEVNDANYVSAENVDFHYAFYISSQTLMDKKLKNNE